MPYQRLGMCVLAVKEAVVNRGYDGSPAVTLRHDAGLRFKSMDQGGALGCF